MSILESEGQAERNGSTEFRSMCYLFCRANFKFPVRLPSVSFTSSYFLKTSTSAIQ